MVAFAISGAIRRNRVRLAVLALLLALAAGLVFWSRSFAAVIAVDTTADELTVNGNCSLREAIQTYVTNVAFDACPNDAADDSIVLPAGTYTLSAALGELLISAPGTLSITGAGAGQTIIDAGNTSRAIWITNNANVTISGVTIRNGNSGATGLGGGVSVVGTGAPTGAALLLRDSVVEGSTAQFGGGVYVLDGVLTIEGSTISGNTAITRGGGVFTNNSVTSILNTTIHGNTVTGASGTGAFDGGGLRSFAGGSVTIRNSTISGNSAANDGGGIATLTTPATAFTFSNSIVAGNTDGGANAPDCVGALTSAGYNLVGDSAGCTLAAGTGDQFGGITTPGAIDPLLGALQLNGGGTPTRAIAAGSPARDAGNPAAPGGAPACATIDQRGIARPQGSGCDIGAFERAETPAIATLSPDSTLLGGSAFTLVVQGSGFIQGRSTVRWNGADRATTFISGSELRITVPAADLTAAGTASVTVFTDLPESGTSDPATFTINNPAPTLSSISPASATAGDGDTQLTVTGTGFVATSVVRWNGADRTTSFVSATELRITIPAADLATAGSASVTVFTPAPGGGTTGILTFGIVNPAPTLSSISPASATAGDGDTQLTVTGTGFVATSVVRWGGADRTTSFVSATELRITIPAADLATAGSVSVTVFTPAPGGGTTGSLTFGIVNPAPTLSSISPASATAGDGDTQLTVTGTGFVATSVVRWGGADRATSFVSATELRITIPAADLATAGSVSVTVFTPAPGGGTSSAQSFTINNPAPTLASLSPASATAGDGDTQLTVTGTGFVATSVVRWGGADRTTSFVSATELRITIPAADLATAGSVSVTVFTPAPGGGTTGILTFGIVNPAPTLSSISPASATAGDGDTQLTVTGTGFVATSVVRWGGADRATSFVSATELRITIPAADLATAGSVSVTVFTPAPGGGTSSAQSFTINNPAPTLASLSPASATAGDGDTQLTVTGTGFVATSVVRWGGADRTTSFVSATELRITIPAADLATAGSVSVTVFTPAPGGGTSGARSFTINNPAPTLGSLSPERVPQQAGGITLAVTGTNFVSTSVVRWNGASRATTFVSATRLDVTLQAGDLATAGSASVTVFSPTPGGGTTSPRTVTIFGPPEITGQPQGQSIAAGGSATLAVTATGEPPLSYQWYLGASPDTGSPVAGADEASLTVTPDASTSYWVRVSNAAGAADSASAQVSIVGAPEITQQPQGASIFAGQTATLTVVATGQGLTYQWYEGASGNTGAPIASATGASFTTPALTTTSSYWVRVTNSVGTSANSSTAVVTVNGPPTIAQPPQGASITSGQTATLTVVASGEGLSYQWYEGVSPSTAQPIASATGASFTTPALTTTSSYWVRVSNPAGAADSGTAVVTVSPAPNPLPTITAISPARAQAGGAGFTLVVEGADFVPGAVVRWNGQGRATTRVSGSRLEISVSAADIATAGSVAITVLNPAPGGGSSAARTLTIEPRPRFTVYLPLVRR